MSDSVYRSGTRVRVQALVLVAIAAYSGKPAVAQALEAEWSLGAELQYSDNIRREPENEESEWIRIGRAALNVDHDSTDLRLVLNADYTYSDYSADTYQDEGTFEGGALVDWDIISDRFAWTVRDRYEQIRVNTTGVDTPANRQSANGFVTGPDLTIPFTSVDFLRLGARYGHYTFSETNEDNQRYGVSVGLARRLSSLTELSLNSRYEQVEFDEETGSQVDYDRTDAYLGLRRRLPNGELSGEAGYTIIERAPRDDIEGVLARLTWRRDLTARSDAGLEASYRISDIAGAFSDPTQDPLSVDADTVAVTGDLADETRVAGYLNTTTGRTDLGGELLWQREDYQEEDALDLQRSRGSATLGYLITRQRSANLRVAYEQVEYDNLDRRDTQWTGAFTLQQRIGRHIVARVAYQREDLDSNIEAVTFEENIYILSLVYSERTAPSGATGR